MARISRSIGRARATLREGVDLEVSTLANPRPRLLLVLGARVEERAQRPHRRARREWVTARRPCRLDSLTETEIEHGGARFSPALGPGGPPPSLACRAGCVVLPPTVQTVTGT
jgi:hypothetical protein